MNTAGRLTGFAAVVALVAGGGWAVGSAIGPPGRRARTRAFQHQGVVRTAGFTMTAATAAQVAPAAQPDTHSGGH